MSIKYPFGNADVQAPAYAATVAVTITNNKTLVTLALTGACTLNLTIDDEVPVGAELQVKATSDTTARTLTPGSGMTGSAIVGTISKNNIINYVYDGSTFVQIAKDKAEPADVQTPDYAATVAVTITKQKTLLNLALTGACTLDLTVNADVRIGAELYIKAGSDGTARTLTPGTAMTGVAVAGVISKTKMISYIFDGTNFIYSGVVQID